MSLNRPVLAVNDPAIMKAYTDSLAKLQEQVAALEEIAGLIRPYLCGYANVLLLLLFKGFDGQPQLAVMTNTLVNCWTDLVHWFIVFFTVFLSFTFAAMFLLGQRMIQFSNIQMAIESCMRILFGDFADYPEMANHDPFTFFVWFTLFIVLISIILINMMLAIVIEVYGMVRNEAAAKESMWLQSYNLVRTFSARRDLTPDWVILQKVETMQKDAPKRRRERRIGRATQL